MNENQILNAKERISEVMKRLQKTSGRKPGTHERVGLSDQLDVQVFHNQLNSRRLNK